MTYGVGAVGGVVYSLATGFLGSGLVGGAAAAALAGSVVKGTKGDMIAIIAGFQTGLALPTSLLQGGGGGDGGGGLNVI